MQSKYRNALMNALSSILLYYFLLFFWAEKNQQRDGESQSDAAIHLTISISLEIALCLSTSNWVEVLSSYAPTSAAASLSAGRPAI